MKLIEVTEEIFQNFSKNNISTLPHSPNILEWMTVALNFNKSIGLSQELMEKIEAQKLKKKKFLVPDNPCWEWKSNRLKKNFLSPLLTSKLRVLSIKRYAYYMSHIEIEQESLTLAYDLMKNQPLRFVRNSCSNKYCIQPEHLQESYTPYDVNILPKSKKGEDHRMSKLTEDIVREIYASDLPFKSIAERYKISMVTVSKIQRGEAWKHLNLTPKPPRKKGRAKKSNKPQE